MKASMIKRCSALIYNTMHSDPAQSGNNDLIRGRGRAVEVVFVLFPHKWLPLKGEWRLLTFDVALTVR